jgi:hypothetical protein
MQDALFRASKSADLCGNDGLKRPSYEFVHTLNGWPVPGYFELPAFQAYWLWRSFLPGHWPGLTERLGLWPGIAVILEQEYVTVLPFRVH